MHIPLLSGCVKDAYSVQSQLARHGDGSPNFDVKLITASGANDAVTRGSLKDAVQELFSSDDDIALFYFAGHGHIEATGTYLCASDVDRGDDGLPLSEVTRIAQGSRVRNKIIVLDSCYSGAAADLDVNSNVAALGEGMTILAAATKDQTAEEENAGGVFTRLFVDALGGAAANLVGDITPGSVYAHIDQSLGNWLQRPVFKTNVKSFVSLRKVNPPIDSAILRKLPEYFPQAESQFQLDPAYEPEQPSAGPNPNADPAKTAVLAMLQKLNRVNLVVPTTEAHMYFAAINSDSVRLTALGEHYRRLAANQRI